jgi:hypothetical protein
MRRRDEYVLRVKLGIPDDYDIHSLRIDFIRRVGTGGPLKADLYDLVDLIHKPALERALGICRVRVTGQHGGSCGFRTRIGLHDLEAILDPSWDDEDLEPIEEVAFEHSDDVEGE